MSSPQRGYVAYLLEDNLGLASGSLEPDRLPGDLVDAVCSTLAGNPSAEVERPFLEEMFLSFLREVEQAELERRGFFVRKARWPGGAPHAVCLTHDVDNISRPLAHAWRTRNRFSNVDFLGHFLRLSPIYNNIEQIAEEERKRGFHSSFYFLTSNYPLAQISRPATELAGRGWDIGLHGDFGTHDSAEKMAEAAGKLLHTLGFRPRGVREHYLKFDFQKTWGIMEAVGFDYDTTVGLNDKLGFRLGLATPFHPPDIEWDPMRLLEIPLTLMDTTLWGYLKKGEESGMAEIQRMIELARSVGGLFTLLWHQEAVKMTGGRLYWRLLDLFRRDDCFVGSGAEIADWWDRRSAALAVDGRSFHFVGDAPADCALLVKTRDQAKIEISGGSVQTNGGSSVIKVLERGMRARVV